MVKHLPTVRETPVRSLSQEDPLEKEMATHSTTLAWKIPWMEEPGRLHTVHGVAKSWTRLSDFTSTEDAVSVLHSLCQQIWKTQQWPPDWKRSILIPIPKKSSTKECSEHETTTLISHASKVMLKVLHARLQHYANQELPDIQAGFRKCRGTRGQLSTFTETQRKQGNSRKTSTSVSSTTLKSLTVWIITNCGKLLKRQTILPVS